MRVSNHETRCLMFFGASDDDAVKTITRQVKFTRRKSAFSQRDAPELVHEGPSTTGRGECRVPIAPAASRAKFWKAHERSHHRFTETVRHSLHNGFNGLFRAPR